MMSISHKKLLMSLLLAVFIIGCGGGETSIDATAPTTVSTNPLETNMSVSINSNIVATFSEDIDSTTCTTSTFILEQGATPVSGTVTCVDRTATFDPTDNLEANTEYTATITTGMKDLAGNGLAANRVWSFTTGATADSTAPTVSFTDPLDMATSVVINRSVTANFSEAVDPLTITTATFTLMKGAVSVSGTVTSAGSVAIFNPTDNLEVNTKYTATITGGVADLADNALASDYVWSFTTGTTVAAGPAPVALGTAGNFAILSKSGISTVPTSVVTGDIGVSPIDQTAVTGFSETADASNAFSTSTQVTGRIYAADYAPPTPTNMTTAISDMEISYTDAAGRTLPDATELGAGEIGGLTIVPGLYKWGTNVLISTDVTLSGGANDVWIFQVAQNLIVANGKQVILAGGAQAQNIFWQVAGQTTLGTTSLFNGIILDQTAIVLKTGAVMIGRALAQTAVTLDQSTVTAP